MRIAIFVLALAAACGSSSTPQKPDAAGSAHIDAAPGAIDAPPSGVDAFASTCGMPGDQGNELGVGKFCATLNDCSNNGSAGLCSNLGDETTHFCTKFCTKGSTTECGTAATCTCNASNQCGCTPDKCL